MARKGQTPAQPVKQEPVESAPNMDSQDIGAPVVEQVEQPPVVETPPEPQPEPEPEPEPEAIDDEPIVVPVEQPEQVAPVAAELDVPALAGTQASAPVEVELDTPAKVDIESLTDYAARIEEAGQPLAVCQITHPDAKDGGLHVGTYAGIRLVRGETPAALLSDGTVI